MTPVDTANLCTTPTYNVDQNGDQVIDLTELMRIIQPYNSPTSAYHCSPTAGTTEDGFVPGPNATLQSCAHSAADTDGNFVITLSEVLVRHTVVQRGRLLLLRRPVPRTATGCARASLPVCALSTPARAARPWGCASTERRTRCRWPTARRHRTEVSEDSHDFGVIAAGGNCASPLLNASLGSLGGAKETLVVGGPSASPALFSFADDVTLPAAASASAVHAHEPRGGVRG